MCGSKRPRKTEERFAVSVESFDVIDVVTEDN